jgi:hypothetical protein
MGLFPFYVETFDTSSHSHRLGDFAQLTTASAAARHALEHPSTVLAVVKDTDGVMVYAADGSKEYIGKGGEAMV